MRIRLKLNIGTNDKEYPPLREGEHEVSDEVGQRLVNRGWAVELPKTIKAVPPAPTIAGAPEGTVEKVASELKTYRAKTSRETEPKSSKNKEQ
jgi:hypothetical protein